MKYAEITFRENTFNQESFTFKIPYFLENKIQIGQIVEVNFRNFLKRGLIIELHDNKPSFETKEVIKPLTPSLINKKQINIIKQISEKTFDNFSKYLSLFIPEKIWKSDGIPPAIEYIILKNADFKARGKKQQELLDTLKKKSKITIQEARKITNIQKLLENEILELSLEEKFNDTDLKIKKDPKTEAFLNKILQKKITLLFGAPKSGKSYIVKQLTKKITQENKQVLILNPEILLSINFIKKLEQEFGKENLLIYHSRLSESEKNSAWWKCKTKQAKIIIGSRSSLFLPFAELGMIAIEEEHDDSYKNEQSPRFHAFDLAKITAKNHDANLVLTSATPRIETFYKGQSRQINLIKINKKSGNKKPLIIDLKNELLKQNKSPISELLKKEISSTISQKKKVMLFINRRGFFSTLFCKDCGQAQKCDFCQISLTHHKKDNKDVLICHHCGRFYTKLNKCKYCKGHDLKFFGFGTQQIEQQLQIEFPEAKITRIDRDSLQKKDKLNSVYRHFTDSDTDILIGTQIISKGFDDEQIGLVAIISADNALQMPDFRAHEKSFALLNQIIGRARSDNSKVLIQTFIPQNKSIQQAINSDYESFYQEEIMHRNTLKLPPFTRIAKLIIKNTSKEKAYKKAQKIHEQIKKNLQKDENAFIAPSLTPFKHGKYNINVFVHSNQPERLIKDLNPKDIKIDIDPIDTL